MAQGPLALLLAGDTLPGLVPVCFLQFYEKNMLAGIHGRRESNEARVVSY